MRDSGAPTHWGNTARKKTSEGSMRLTAEQREGQILSFLYLGMPPSAVARAVHVSRRAVLRLKRRHEAQTHKEEKYPPRLIAQIIRLHHRGLSTKQVAYEVEIPLYQAQRIFRDYRLRAPKTGARYDISIGTERAIRRHDRKWMKALASRFGLPLRSIQKILRRKP
jgi:hypothetical protein